MGENNQLFEELKISGGCLDGAGHEGKGNVIRGCRMIEVINFPMNGCLPLFSGKSD